MIRSPGLRWLGLGLALLLCVGTRGVLAEDEPRPGSPAVVTSDDPARSLNQASRALYARGKATALGQAGHVLIVKGDLLILRRGSDRTELTFVPRVYHDLKTFSHIALALDVAMLEWEGNSQLGDDVFERLRGYRTQIAAARAALPELGLSPAQTDRQQQLADAATAFIEARLKSRACSSDERRAFASSVAPWLQANMRDGARAALDALDRAVRDLKDAMTAAEWRGMRVIVMGRQLPRADNLVVQYFARLLREPGEGRRIIYAESINDETQALDLLATHLVDRDVGRDFFNDDARMHRDLLGEATRDYLPQLLP